MDLKLKGRFLSTAKLDVLLSANGISIGSLVTGATDKINELTKVFNENSEKAYLLIKEASWAEDVANKAKSNATDIENALKAISNTEDK